jgi:hypothetical protein
MKDFIIKMLSDDDSGNISSKRVITLLSFILVSIGYCVNIFWDIPIKQFIFDGMLYLVAAGMGITALEKFSKK